MDHLLADKKKLQDGIPHGDNMKKLEKKVLAEGELTGHAHRVEVDVFEDKTGLRYFEGKTKVTHEEHKQIEIPEGRWTSGRVREYDHFSEEAKIIED